MRRFTLLFVLSMQACVEPYSGTRLDLNLGYGGQVTSQSLILPTPGLKPGDPGYFSHYELFAEIDGVGLVRLLTFQIRPAVETRCPCLQFIEDRFCVPKVHGCDPYLNVQRFARLEELLAVVPTPPASPVSEQDNPFGFDFVPPYDYAAWPAELFHDPDLTDDASKLARENLRQDEVEAFCQKLPEDFYVGNPLLLGAPLHGRIFGLVDGTDPRSGIQVGGITLFVPGKLHHLTELLVTKEPDPSRVARGQRDRRDLLPSPGSVPFLVARSDGSIGAIRTEEVRGVVSFVMENPFGLEVRARGVIFEDIDQDPIVF